MKEKIFNALKAAILIGGKTSVSDATIQMYTGLIDVEKITEESQIADAIKPYVPILQATQANINSIAKVAVETKESELNTIIEGLKNNPPKPQDPPKDDTPEWAKSLLTKVESLEGNISEIKGEKLQTSLSQKLTETLKGKSIPDWYYGTAIEGRTFKDEAEINSFAESLSGRWEIAKQELANNGFKETVPPGTGDSQIKETESIAAAINAGTQKIVEQEKK